MIALISDIHGNVSALERVLAEIRTLNVERLICLGDVAGYYPDVDACCALLESAGAICLQGNHDWYLATGNECPRSNSANRCLELQHEVTSEATKRWLGSLPTRITQFGLDCFHEG